MEVENCGVSMLVLKNKASQGWEVGGAGWSTFVSGSELVRTIHRNKQLRSVLPSSPAATETQSRSS